MRSKRATGALAVVAMAMLGACAGGGPTSAEVSEVYAAAVAALVDSVNFDPATIRVDSRIQESSRADDGRGSEVDVEAVVTAEMRGAVTAALTNRNVEFGEYDQYFDECAPGERPVFYRLGPARQVDSATYEIEASVENYESIIYFALVLSEPDSGWILQDIRAVDHVDKCP